jgi:hypothetical protein
MAKSGENSKQGWIIALLIGAVVIGGGVGLYAYFSGKGKDQNDEDSADEGGGDELPTVTNPDTLDLFSSLPLGYWPLKKGKKSKLVFVLQKYLNCKGNVGATATSAIAAPLVIDGNFGSKTEAALKRVLGVSIILSVNNFKELVAKNGSLGGCEAIMLSKISEIQGQ